MRRQFQYREAVDDHIVFEYDEKGIGWSKWKNCTPWEAREFDGFPAIFEVRSYEDANAPYF